MTTDQVKHIIDELVKLQVTVLTFTGGEPTLRSDLGELIDYAASKGLMTSLISNGYLIEDLVKAGKLKNLELPMISIDFPNAELHDKYRGLESYDRAIRAIRALTKSGKKCVISSVITKESLPYMEQMCELAKKFHCMIELLPCENIVRNVEDQDLEVQDIERKYIPDLKEWEKEIRRLKKKYPYLLTTDKGSIRMIAIHGFGRYNKLKKWYMPPTDISIYPLFECYVATVYVFINYKGEVVYPCKLHPILSKDATKYSLEKIYHSPEVGVIQKMKDGYDFCKGCRLGCAINSSITMYGRPIYKKYVKPFLFSLNLR
jgi:MoaA/NifB/PqqE/SkfB family radical SAM enzyme